MSVCNTLYYLYEKLKMLRSSTKILNLKIECKKGRKKYYEIHTCIEIKFLSNF